MQQLESIANEVFIQLAQQPIPDLPPLHLWNPPSRGKLNMQIKPDGSWFYEGSEIQRRALVKLFASILRKEEDEQFYLVTPHEKFQIGVDDAPFTIIDAEVCTINDIKQINLRSNVDDYLILDEAHPLIMENERPYIKIRDGLWALVNRSVFYRLADHAEQRTIDGVRHMVLHSALADFSIGVVS